ncbi:ABC transporter permease [Shinella pollutisoli]|uniref:ABC transporter permease n=1 Tax=Shinella pollutisoli TaxID=2250594 RepID=A0ABV7DIV4_9HYPH|nr:ABC transporter permease [Shinella pollutisoli]
MRRSGDITARLLWAAGLLVLGVVSVYVALPVAIAFVMSFSGGQILRFPIQSWSLRWYADFFGSPQYVDALVNTLVIALGATVLSVAAGTASAWAISRRKNLATGALTLLHMLPLFVPGVVLGLGIAITFGNVRLFGMDLYGTRFIVMLAHSLWGMPLVMMLMETTFRSLDRQVLEASRDLGAGPFTTFREIVLPEVRTAILSSALFSFVVSVNEFYMALFLTTRDTQTLPVLMWLSLRSAGSPRLAVAAVVLMTIVLVSLVLLASGLRRKERVRG